MGLSASLERTIGRRLTVRQRLVLLLSVFVVVLATLFLFRGYVVALGPWLALSGFACLVLLSVAASGLVSRSIVRPLERTIEYCDAIAQGRYDTAIDVGLPDELGDVMRALDRMQDRLRANEATLRMMSGAIEHSPASIVMTDRSGRITYVNPKFSAVTGYSSAEAVGQNPRLLKSGLQSAAFYAEMWSALSAGREWRGEFANRKKSGELFWERASISPIPDARGECASFVAVKEDITDTKAAEESLRRSEERFALAVRATKDGIWDWDLGTNALFYSAQWREMLGYADGDLEPEFSTFERLVHPDDADRTFAAIRGYVDGTADTYHVEMRMRHKLGQWVDIMARGFAARGPDGRAVRIVGTHVDITDRKHAEQRLAAQYAATLVLAEAQSVVHATPRFLQAIAEAAGWDVGCAWAVPADLSRMRCAAVWHTPGVNVEGWKGSSVAPGEGLLGRAWTTATPAWCVDASRDPDARPAALAAGLRSLVAVPIRIGDRVVSVVEFLSRDIRQRDEGFIEMFASIAPQIGLTIERRRTRNAVQLAEQKYRDIVERSNQGVYQMTPDGRFLSANAALARLFGCANASELLDKPAGAAAEFYLDTDRREEFARLMEQRGSVSRFESRVRRTDGRIIWTAENARAIRDGSGRLLHYEGFVDDITAAKEAEQLKSDFVSFVTHQLRTPLSGIRWMLELTSELELPEEAASYVVDARASAERLIGLVNDLLDVARLESGKLVADARPTDLKALTDDVVSELLPLVRERQHNLSVTGSERCNMVLMDPQLGRQAVLNLLSNAIKYTPPAGTIAVQLRHTGDLLEWSVRDNGIGVGEAGQRQLFEKFYRADNARTVDTEGTGLGLYLVRLIIERSHGRIWCESTEGAGTTFRFTLPLIAGPAGGTSA